MTGEAVGRNDPCRCGSGRKYKKCCLARDQAEAPKVVEPPDPLEMALQADHEYVQSRTLQMPAGITEAEARKRLERLNAASKAAREALDGGRIDEAERLSDWLRSEYPDQIDGYEMRAVVRVQQKRWAEAADGFDEAAAVASKNPDEFGLEFIEGLRHDAAHARAHAQGQPGSSDVQSPDSHAHGHWI